MDRCSHPHVVVTGASSGIGRATALRLAVSGYHVYAGIRRPADGAALVQGGGREITPVLLDVTDGGQISAAADTVAGSIGARFTPPFVGALAASKSALASMDEALRQELAPWGIHVVLVEPATVRSEAVDKLDHDAARLMSQASPAQQALYGEAFGHLVDTFAARHRHGSPPEVIAATVDRALTSPRPRARYLTGKDSRRMAILAAVLPAPALDALRRRLGGQPAPGSRVPAPPATHVAEPAMR